METERWVALQQTGKFEDPKALSSFLALPQNLPRVKPATHEQALSTAFPTLATVRKYHGEMQSLASVVEIVSEAAALMNVGKNLQSHQIEFIAGELTNQFYFLTIAEIRFFMLEGVRGKYGPVYDCLDVNRVFEWLNKYLDIRAEIVSNRAIRAHVEIREEESQTAIFMPDELKKLAEKLDNTFLVDGELKKGLPSGEFEPDEPTLRMIEMEWADLPEAIRQPYENYKALRIAHLKTQMKK